MKTPILLLLTALAGGMLYGQTEVPRTELAAAITATQDWISIAVHPNLPKFERGHILYFTNNEQMIAVDEISRSSTVAIWKVVRESRGSSRVGLPHAKGESLFIGWPPTTQNWPAFPLVPDCGMVNGVLVSKPCKQYAEEIAKRLEKYEKPNYTQVTVESSGVRVMAHLGDKELAAIRKIFVEEFAKAGFLVLKNCVDGPTGSNIRLCDAAGGKP